ncbi:MAG: peptidylprolyl isomerase [bacterium]
MKRSGIFFLFTALLLVLISCNEKQVAKQGDTVRVRYVGTTQDGTVFDSSNTELPIVFTIGNNQVILGFEEAIVGMAPGETKNVSLPPEKAYGLPLEENKKAFALSDFPPHIVPEVGMELQMDQPGGQPSRIRVVDIANDSAYLDANDPLAGQTLNFELELIEIMKL